MENLSLEYHYEHFVYNTETIPKHSIRTSVYHDMQNILKQDITRFLDYIAPKFSNNEKLVELLKHAQKNVTNCRENDRGIIIKKVVEPCYIRINNNNLYPIEFSYFEWDSKACVFDYYSVSISSDYKHFQFWRDNGFVIIVIDIIDNNVVYKRCTRKRKGGKLYEL